MKDIFDLIFGRKEKKNDITIDGFVGCNTCHTPIMGIAKQSNRVEGFFCSDKCKKKAERFA